MSTQPDHPSWWNKISNKYTKADDTYDHLYHDHCIWVCIVVMMWLDARTSSCQRFKHNTSFMSRLSTRRKDPTSTNVMLPMSATVGSVSPLPSPQHRTTTSPQSPNPLSSLSSSTRFRSTNILLSPFDLSESCDGRLQSSASDANDFNR